MTECSLNALAFLLLHVKLCSKQNKHLYVTVNCSLVVFYLTYNFEGPGSNPAKGKIPSDLKTLQSTQQWLGT